MISKAAIRAEAARLQALIGGATAEAVETDILQPASTLLDLYGEDIRARAYVTADPARGEQMLRPDFTVPVVQMHMERAAHLHGVEARYTYAGEVFRRQEEAHETRPAEFIQVGLELFGCAAAPGPMPADDIFAEPVSANPVLAGPEAPTLATPTATPGFGAPPLDAAAQDAEVFATLANALRPLRLTAAMGDIGLLTAAVSGLSVSPSRRAALMRHIWRPRRFRALLDRFAGQRPPGPGRAALLERLETESAEALVAESGPVPGKRSASEIAARLAALAADAAEPPLPLNELALIDEILALRAAPAEALARLYEIARQMPRLEPATDRLSARLDALSDRGVVLDEMIFETAFGRTTLEYYDGFVFGLFAPERTDLPPVASGGRYDALTAKLGAGRAISAVGGVIRPGLVLELREAAGC